MADLADPRIISFEQWVGVALMELSQHNIPSSADEQNWQDWATAVVNNPELESQGLPDPRLFSDWRSWAMQFVYALS